MEPWTRTEPTILNRGNPAQTGRRLGQGERSPSNKPYLQRVTEWTLKRLPTCILTVLSRGRHLRLRIGDERPADLSKVVEPPVLL